MRINLDDYVQVDERIAEFREKYPDGSLQAADPLTPYRIETVGDKTFITYCAAAYRTPDDPRPGIGCAWEPVPGKTPYTKDSELMNAETSAWGRAIVAVLAADTKRGIASQEEVRNRQEVRANPEPTPAHDDSPYPPETKAYLASIIPLFVSDETKAQGRAYVKFVLGDRKTAKLTPPNKQNLEAIAKGSKTFIDGHLLDAPAQGEMV